MKLSLFFIALFIMAILLVIEWGAALSMRNLTFLVIGGLLAWYFLWTDSKQ